MDADLRPLQRALKELGFTSPLRMEDARYVPRQDALGRQLLNRLRAPTAPTLLLGGPAGCGKSTELIHIQSELRQDFAVFLCPCDRDLDLYRLKEVTLYRYILWRVLSLCLSNLVPTLQLTKEIITEVHARIGTQEMRMERPYLFFSTEPVPEAGRDPDALSQTLHRLLSEIGRFRNVLLLLDGLEKVPASTFSEAVAPFARSPALRSCQTLLVLPYWSLHGWESPAQWQNVDVLEIPIVTSNTFVQDVTVRRTGDVLDPLALHRLGLFNGGVVRDGLQLAASAVRFALDEGVVRAGFAHADKAIDEMRVTYKRIFSDDLDRARRFLKHIIYHGELPADTEWRTRMLASGAVLPGPGGTFFVHPVLVEV
ncbi:AAA family ATPase [Stigmatella sp. ncwal1]|uniref:AAA family ATPase n=1 Tax=Stigmatella ashevillensis TaxID=2995309 RepID=A0ABT5D9Q9_9BACT|nr:AAA family ATPase [Stigmatella ashevillena]MDC0710412.1 AAA family ATPase [Stigmatella ashevillena]